MKLKKAFLSLLLILGSVILTVALVEAAFFVLLKMQKKSDLSFSFLSQSYDGDLAQKVREKSPPVPAFADVFADLRNEKVESVTEAIQEVKDEQGILRELRDIKKLQPGGKTLYDLTYHYDEYGRRVTPAPKKFRRFVALLGCSFTLNQGLPDDETSAVQLAKQRPQEKILNFGIMGGSIAGLHQIWADPQFHGLDDVQGKPGVLVYLLYDFHYPRLTCPRSCFTPESEWIQKLPYYSLNSKDELVDHGSFLTGRPLKNTLYRILAKSSFLDFFHIEVPPQWSQSDSHLLIRLLKDTQLQAQKKTTIEKTVILVMPSIRNDFLPDLRREAAREGIEVFDFSKFDIGKKSLSIPFDDHPTAEQAWWNAQLINYSLNQINL